MLPEVVGPGQHAPVLHPDDLLMDEGAAFSQQVSSIAWRREACQQYQAAFSAMASATAAAMKPS